MDNKEYIRVQLIDRIHISDSILKCIFKADTFFNVVPSQHITFKIEGVLKTYSIAEKLPDNCFSIYIKLVEKGIASGYFYSMKLKSNFDAYLTESSLVEVIDRSTVFIGLGTGVVPLYTIVSHLLQNGTDNNFHFLYAAHDKNDLFYKEKLTSLAEDNDNLDLDITHHGGVGKTIRGLINLYTQKYPDNLFLIAARPEISISIKKQLIASGIDNSLIHIL